MSKPPSLALAAAILGGLFLSGCATPSDTADSKSEAYTDPASGVVFPMRCASLDRVSLNKDDSGKNPVSAHYTGGDEVHAPADSMPLMQSQISFYLNADIQVIPSSRATPEELLGQTIRSSETNPNFVQGDYKGLSSFGNQKVPCAQCSFDRPAWNDRVTFKVVIVPHGNYLLCFGFLVRASQEDKWQPVIDSFIQDILAKATRKVLMSPEDTPSDSESGT